MNEKYLQGMDYYNVKVINDIIYNDDTHLVSLFKDYLILDDIRWTSVNHFIDIITGFSLTKDFKWSEAIPL